MKNAVELRPLDDHLDIDTETGEIVGEDHELVIDDLPKIARQMRALNAGVAIARQYQSDEVRRITDYCNDKARRLQKQYEFFERIAQQMLEQSGQKKIEYPGLGTLRFAKQREKVDDTGYYAMSEQEQLHVQTQNPGCFTTKKTVTPNKKEIKARLQEDSTSPDGFEVVRPDDKFEFVPER